MGWTARIGIAAVVLLFLGAIALTVYGSMVRPPHRTYEQTLSDDRFPS